MDTNKNYRVETEAQRLARIEAEYGVDVSNSFFTAGYVEFQPDDYEIIESEVSWYAYD